MSKVPDLPPPYRWYNGADASSVSDADGSLFYAGSFMDDSKAKDTPDAFEWGIFKYSADNQFIKRLPLPDEPLDPSGRGEIDVSPHGKGYYTATLGVHSRVRGLIPEFAPFPPIKELQARLEQLAGLLDAYARRVIELEKVLADVRAGALDPDDRASLDWVLKVRGLE